MKTRIAASLLVGALLLAGCDASTAPGATPGNGTQAGTGGNVNLAGLYTVGKKWEYAFSTASVGTNMSGTMAMEVVSVSGNEATLKTTTQLGTSAPVTSESKVKLNESTNWANMGSDSNKNVTAGPLSTESVTVPAGTFPNAKKQVYTLTDPQADGTITVWYDEAIGLIKHVSSIKPKAELPSGVNIPGMPAGGLDLSSTTTLELKTKP